VRCLDLLGDDQGVGLHDEAEQHGEAGGQHAETPDARSPSAK
jgi:hypothetical protein